MIVLSTLACVMILIILPFMAGMLPVSFMKDVRPGLTYPAGLFLMLFAFELVCVPVVLLTRGSSFAYVSAAYTPVMIVLAAVGLWRGIKSGLVKQMKTCLGSFKMGPEQAIAWGIAVLILVVTIVLMETRVIFDGDDAYYVVQSLSAWQNGTMYSTDPYTGKATAVDMRHALAVFTMWIAYVGRMTRIHTTILCHSVLPVLIVPLTVLIYGCTGSELLGERREMLPYFIIFVELIILFGRVSIYTPETFLLARAWQGKAVAANVLLPMTVLSLLLLARAHDDGITTGACRGEWLMLALVNATAGVFSSLAVELVSVLMGVGGVVLAVRAKRIKPFVMMVACCIPGIVYMLLYVYYAFYGWR